MNTRTKLLCSFVVFLFVGSIFMTGVNAYITKNSTNADQMTTADNYGDDRRHEAVNILFYTEVSDLSVGGEYDHVRGSLIGSLEGKFTYANLTHFSQLGAMIGEFDVFIIPELENANYTFAETVNAAWAGILPDFVNNGGIVISMGYEDALNRGAATKTINNTLIHIYDPVGANSHQIDVFDQSDALARNVATFTAVSGTFSFDCPDATKVMEDNTDARPTVVHKTMGKGHVVVLGFDMFNVQSDQDFLLMNAVLLHQHVVFDNSHTQSYSITSGYSEIADTLPYYGFSVSSMNIFNPSVLESCEILVITLCIDEYNATEISIIHDFVNSGGGLFIFTEWGTFGGTLDGLINDFGFVRNTTAYLLDTDEHSTFDYWPQYTQPDNFEIHSATLGVDVVEMYAGTGFISMPATATPLIVTDTDGTSTWDDSNPALGIPIAAANLVGAGRIVVLGDNAPLRDSDVDSDGTSGFTDSDNAIFMRDSFSWLAGAGIPEQTVVFDQSHSPYGYIHSNWAPLANFLMFNGYNLEYMYTFDPTAYADADILVICDGDVGYNATEIAQIKSYVAGGGGLLLWGDNGIYGQEIAPIGIEFGLELNTTGYLDDTDDFDTFASYVIYESANFANHPIMDGVHRIEVDRGPGFISIGSGTALVRGDNDNTSIYIDGTPAPNIPVFAAALHNMGRVVFLTDVNMAQTVDPESDGFGDLYDSDNPVFVANVFKWLAENRAPTVEVMSPNGGEVLNGTITVSWDAVDFDSDSLTFEVWYTDNNGSDWSLLEDGLVTNTYDWNTTLHDDGNSYMIRVIASDGLSTGQDDSDNPFELDNYAGGGGAPIDPTLLIIIAAAGVVVVIIIIIFMKKKK